MPSGGGSTNTIQSADPWEGVQPFLRNQYGLVDSMANNPLPYYPGSTYAPFNPLQIGGQYAALDYAQNRFQPGVGSLQGSLAQNINQQLNPAGTNPFMNHYQAMFNAPNQVLANANQPWLDTMFGSPDEIASNPQLQALKDANERRVTDSFMRKTMPAIRSGAQMSGQYGGSREALASGVAQGDAAEALANANAQVDMNAWNTAMGQRQTAAQLQNQNVANAMQQRTAAGQLMDSTFGRQLSGSLDAMRMMPGALQLGFMGPEMAMNIGGMQQSQYQRAIDDMMARYYYPQDTAWDMQGQAAAIYGGAQPYASSRTRSDGSGDPLSTAMGLGSLGIGAYNAGLFGAGAAGTAAAAGTLAGSLAPATTAAISTGLATAPTWAMPATLGFAASDRRMKKDIKPLGERDGYQWYEFEYKDPDTYGHGKQIGVMADEVEKINPDAVITMSNGYKAVNYGAL